MAETGTATAEATEMEPTTTDSPATAQEAQSQESQETPAEGGEDWEAELSKWKYNSRKNERLAKESQAKIAELERLVEEERQAKMELEEARNAEAQSAKVALLRAELKVRAHGRFIEPGAVPSLISDADLADIDPGDGDAIDALLSKVAESYPGLVKEGKAPSVNGGVSGIDGDINLGELDMAKYMELTGDGTKIR